MAQVGEFRGAVPLAPLLQRVDLVRQSHAKQNALALGPPLVAQRRRAAARVGAYLTEAEAGGGVQGAECGGGVWGTE